MYKGVWVWLVMWGVCCGSETLTLVVDPAHGGRDPGVVSTHGAAEKDIVLEYAKAIAEHAKFEVDITVLLTRQGDDTIDFDERVAMANRVGAHVFVSLHMDALPSTTLAGVKLWVTKRASRAVRRRGAKRRPLLWEYVQFGLIKKSRRFAQDIMAEWYGLGNDLYRTVPEEWGSVLDPSIGRAPLRGLRGTAMPALCVNLGYLSSEADEQRLRDPTWKGLIAEAVLRGTRRFLRARP